MAKAKKVVKDETAEEQINEAAAEAQPSVASEEERYIRKDGAEVIKVGSRTTINH